MAFSTLRLPLEIRTHVAVELLWQSDMRRPSGYKVCNAQCNIYIEADSNELTRREEKAAQMLDGECF